MTDFRLNLLDHTTYVWCIITKCDLYIFVNVLIGPQMQVRAHSCVAGQQKAHGNTWSWVLCSDEPVSTTTDKDASITTQQTHSTEEESSGHEMSSSKQTASDVQGGNSISSTPDTTEEGISQSANPTTPKQPTSTPQPHTTKEEGSQSSGAGGTAFSSTQAVYISSAESDARTTHQPGTTEDVSSVGSVQTTNSEHSLSSARNDISPSSRPTIPQG